MSRTASQRTKDTHPQRLGRNARELLLLVIWSAGEQGKRERKGSTTAKEIAALEGAGAACYLFL